MDAPPIEVRQLVYRYPGATTVSVDRLDVTLAPGEVLGLLGPNGAGKTTTLHAILGLVQPTGGTVRLFGRSPIADRVAVLPRLNFASVDIGLPSNLTVQECLTIVAGLYGVRDARGRIRSLLEQFDVTALKNHLVGSLSSGEQMRVKLCKALLNEPELLLLDEPTLSLDPYLAQKVRGALKELQRTRGLAILHTSHNMREVETFCDRILFLHQGRMLAEGPPKEVVARFNSRSLDELFIRVATTGDLIDAA